MKILEVYYAKNKLRPHHFHWAVERECPGQKIEWVFAETLPIDFSEYDLILLSGRYWYENMPIDSNNKFILKTSYESIIQKAERFGLKTINKNHLNAVNQCANIIQELQKTL